MKKIVQLFIVSIIIINNSAVLAQNEVSKFTSSIEKKHKKDVFLQKKYISYDISVEFGGKEILNGNFTQETGGGKIKLTKSDGSVVIFDGKTVQGKGISEKGKGMARFHIFTWPYFLGTPYKLNDNGTKWSNYSKQKWNEKSLETGKLSFESGIGDAPDDWYVVYKNTDNLLAGSAYIVSYGKGKAVAEKEPHAIKYNDYKFVDNIPFSTNWSFHLWNSKEGYTDVIGEVKLSNIKFLDNADFIIPEGSQIIEKPNK